MDHFWNLRHGRELAGFLSVRYVCEGEPCVYGSEQVLEALIEDAQEIQEAVQETVEKQLEDLSVGEISVNEAGVISAHLQQRDCHRFDYHPRGGLQPV